MEPDKSKKLLLKRLEERYSIEKRALTDCVESMKSASSLDHLNELQDIYEDKKKALFAYQDVLHKLSYNEFFFFDKAFPRQLISQLDDNTDDALLLNELTSKLSQ